MNIKQIASGLIVSAITSLTLTVLSFDRTSAQTRERQHPQYNTVVHLLGTKVGMITCSFFMENPEYVYMRDNPFAAERIGEYIFANITPTETEFYTENRLVDSQWFLDSAMIVISRCEF